MATRMQFHATTTKRLVGKLKSDTAPVEQTRQMVVDFRGNNALNTTPHDQNRRVVSTNRLTPVGGMRECLA